MIAQSLASGYAQSVKNGKAQCIDEAQSTLYLSIKEIITDALPKHDIVNNPTLDFPSLECAIKFYISFSLNLIAFRWLKCENGILATESLQAVCLFQKSMNAQRHLHVPLYNVETNQLQYAIKNSCFITLTETEHYGEQLSVREGEIK